jgi:hypothetical protein
LLTVLDSLVIVAMLCVSKFRIVFFEFVVMCKFFIIYTRIDYNDTVEYMLGHWETSLCWAIKKSVFSLCAVMFIVNGYMSTHSFAPSPAFIGAGIGGSAVSIPVWSCIGVILAYIGLFLWSGSFCGYYFETISRHFFLALFSKFKTFELIPQVSFTDFVFVKSNFDILMIC